MFGLSPLLVLPHVTVNILVRHKHILNPINTGPLYNTVFGSGLIYILKKKKIEIWNLITVYSKGYKGGLKQPSKKTTD